MPGSTRWGSRIPLFFLLTLNAKCESTADLLFVLCHIVALLLGMKKTYVVACQENILATGCQANLSEWRWCRAGTIQGQYNSWQLLNSWGLVIVLWPAGFDKSWFMMTVTHMNHGRFHQFIEHWTPWCTDVVHACTWLGHDAFCGYFVTSHILQRARDIKTGSAEIFYIFVQSRYCSCCTSLQSGDNLDCHPVFEDWNPPENSRSVHWSRYIAKFRNCWVWLKVTEKSSLESWCSSGISGHWSQFHLSIVKP